VFGTKVSFSQYEAGFIYKAYKVLIQVVFRRNNVYCGLLPKKINKVKGMYK